jgi:thioredoxin-related protein
MHRLRLILPMILLLSALPAQAAELVMFESAGCSYCLRWNREIGPIYPKTSEGRIAHLRRVDINEPRPADLAGIHGIVYTPTFVLLHNGKEVGRITGYGGEDFFWGMLAELVGKLPKTDATRAPRHRSTASQ